MVALGRAKNHKVSRGNDTALTLGGNAREFDSRLVGNSPHQRIRCERVRPGGKEGADGR